MAPSNPKRPPRPPRQPGSQASLEEPELELPFDDDEVMPLRVDDPRPQRVPQFPAGPRKGGRRSGGSREAGRDRELPSRFNAQEYSDPGWVQAFLYVEKGPGAGQLVPLRQGLLVMGRSSTCDLRLQHPSISRRHAQLLREGNRFTLRDLGSQNGTFINRVRQTSEVELQLGDELALGNALLRLRGAGAAAEPSAARQAPASAPPGRRTSGTSLMRVALVAATVGSAVAALLTLALVKLLEPSEPPSKAPLTEAPIAEASVVEASVAKALAPELPPEPRPSKPAPARPRAATAERKAEKAPSQPAPGTLVVSEAAVRTEQILKRYEAGQVDEALAMARQARLDSLATRIAAYQAALRAGEKALAAGDKAGALTHLSEALKLDEGLSHGWSVQGRALRQRLNVLRGAGPAR